jgi:hypothetical protein
MRGADEIALPEGEFWGWTCRPGVIAGQRVMGLRGLTAAQTCILALRWLKCLSVAIMRIDSINKGNRMKSALKKWLASSFLVCASVGAPLAYAAGPQIGAGIGIPYGGLGVKLSYDVDLNETVTVSPTVGVGTVITGTGLDVGVQFYFGSRESAFRNGIGVWYGTNAVVFNFFQDWSGKGVTLGLTPKFQFGAKKNHTVDAYLLYIASSTMDCPNGHVCNPFDGGRAKVGVGYAYGF